MKLWQAALFCLCGQQLKIHGETTITKRGLFGGFLTVGGNDMTAGNAILIVAIVTGLESDRSSLL